jgi:ubiquinone/menaquinone biosynthesis C-methylase UbiE
MSARNAREHAAFLLPHLRPGLRLLDCGCGPAVMTAELAAIVTPGPVIGVDVSAAQFEIGRSTARASGTENLQLITASVERLPFDDHEFDVVFSHALLEHVRDVGAAVAELSRVLAPGGVLGICSPDWGGFLVSPATPEILDALSAYERLQATNGGNPRVGRELANHTASAGLRTLEVAARYECYADCARIANYLAEHLETSGLTRAASALRHWAPEAMMFAQAWVSVVARKPTA